MSKMHCVSATAVMRDAPNDTATTVSEVLFGEELSIVAEAASGFSEVRSTHDQYSGFIRNTVLAPRNTPATHRVNVRSTLVFPEPGVKHPPNVGYCAAMLFTFGGITQPLISFYTAKHD